jgi:sialidase-1
VKIGAGPVHGIHTRSGRLIAPSYISHIVDGKGRGQSCVIYSDDHGKTWEAGGVIPWVPEFHTGECTVLEKKDGALLMNMRAGGPSSYSFGWRTVSTSTDGGKSWSMPVTDKNLPEPACQASITRLNADEILFLNPAVHRKGGFHLWSRNSLTLRLSRDEGHSWPVSRVLNKGLAGYSDMAITGKGHILCIFENGERDYCEKITIACLDRSWLLAGEKQ